MVWNWYKTKDNVADPTWYRWSSQIILHPFNSLRHLQHLGLHFLMFFLDGKKKHLMRKAVFEAHVLLQHVLWHHCIKQCYMMATLQQLAITFLFEAILRCQVKSDMGRPPIGYMTAVTQRGRAVEFLAVLPLEAQEWREWAPFTKFHSSGAPILIEIDMKKGDK